MYYVFRYRRRVLVAPFPVVQVVVVVYADNFSRRFSIPQTETEVNRKSFSSDNENVIKHKI